MRIGVTFPTWELVPDRDSIRTYVSGVAALGFTHISTYDHVLAVDRRRHPEFATFTDRPPTHEFPVHEPFTLLSFVAGMTDLEVATGILVLPQRQTVLVAKQAAELDVLSAGRLRVGVGMGWNRLEYEALGVPFDDRARRFEEQIELLRALWSSDTVDYSGQWHLVAGMGLAPPPVQRPIPLWIGAVHPAALARLGRIADGWVAFQDMSTAVRQQVATIRDAAQAAGRDPEAIGIDARVEVGDKDLRRIQSDVRGWQDIGATHLSLSTMRSGLVTAQDHLEALSQAAEVLL